MVSNGTEASCSRRSVLAAVGTGIAGGVAGCLDSSASVSVLAAGSLAQTVEHHVCPAFESETDTAVHGEYYGSNALLRMVEDRMKTPDVVVSADATLLRDRLYDEYVSGDVEFATNALGICYAPSTELGERLDAGEPWYEPVRDADDGAVAITDPDLDPLGYRALLAFELAERKHGLDGFRDTVGEAVYREPEEPQLLAGVAAGNRAAAISYRNMAVDHDLPFRSFPPAYNFADPAYADDYATVSFVTDDGYEVVGRPIVYNAAIPDDADNPDAAESLVAFLATSPSLLETAGLSVPDPYPQTAGVEPGVDL